VKRAKTTINDNWRYKLATLAGGDVLNSCFDTAFRESVGDLLCNIVKSFSYFKMHFTMSSNNYLYVPIYCNDTFGYGRGLENKLNGEFFGISRLGPQRNKILGITWSDIKNGNVLKNRI
jgi:hypothetical protein